MPNDAGQQIIGCDPEDIAKLHDRVEARDTLTALELGDLGSVQASANARLLLGEFGALAKASKVLAKEVSDFTHNTTPFPPS
ncbi:MAG TPA: hypothetical protein VG816_03990 [Solirubrobacterales bacterium]|nr:hypothetical protein [Solirubrobacterales bacterium]